MRRVIVFLALLPCAAAQAQDRVERFQLERNDDGYVRLDTQTGAVSVCREDGDQLVCRLSADERSAMESETDRLRADLAALEKRVAALEAAPAVKLPSEEDVDKTLGLMERFLRRFIDIARDRDEPAAPSPDRTNFQP